MTIQWSEKSDMEETGRKVSEFVTAEGIDEADWTSSVVYADGSVNDAEKHNQEANWPITVKFIKKTSLSESDIAKQNYKEVEQHGKEEEQAAQADEHTRKDEEAKAAAEDARKLAEKRTAREAEEAGKAAAAAEEAKKKEEEERKKVDRIAREAEEANQRAQEATDAMEAEALRKHAETKIKEHEKQEQVLKAAAKETRELVAERLREEREADEARKVNEAIVEASQVRNLKWRWADHIVWGYPAPRAMWEDNWNQPATREDLAVELEKKVTEGIESEIKQRKTRRVEVADERFPVRRRTFADYTKLLEWLVLQLNIHAPKEEL